MVKARFILALSVFGALFLAGSAAFCAPKHGKKPAKSERVTILDMSGPVEADGAMPTISKKGPL